MADQLAFRDRKRVQTNPHHLGALRDVPSLLLTSSILPHLSINSSDEHCLCLFSPRSPECGERERETVPSQDYCMLKFLIFICCLGQPFKKKIIKPGLHSEFLFIRAAYEILSPKGEKLRRRSVDNYRSPRNPQIPHGKPDLIN